jgi:myo-inositol-1-phosphate synthase
MTLVKKQLGIWLVGARGAVATTTIVGTLALERGLVAPLGMATAREPLSRLPLAPLDAIVFGGHDRSDLPLAAAARALERDAGPLRAELRRAVEDGLVAVEDRLRPAPARATPLRRFVDAVKRDLAEFRAATGVTRVVVVNVATTEPPATPDPAHADLRRLDEELDKSAPRDGVLPDSLLYAYAALASGCPYVNFTPSFGATAPALEQLALERGVPHAGRDGKTGETLLKSALAPMFAMRQLRVRSWTGFNVLGNADGEALANPETAASKVASKAGLIPAILGYEPHNTVRIDYVPPLGDWKTAWDLIQFEGFLHTPMTLQLTWQGSDSALAAPLVLDLARLIAVAAERGERGMLGWLGFYFKTPQGSDVHDLATQFDILCQHIK